MSGKKEMTAEEMVAATRQLEELKRIGEEFCDVRFVTGKNEEGQDELRIWITVDAQIWDLPMGLPTDPKTIQRVQMKLEGHAGAGVGGTGSAVKRLKKMFDEANGCWKMELHRLYIVLDATSVGYRRAWGRRPEDVYELLDFFRSGDVGKMPRGIDWDQYPNSVEWTNEKDLP